MEATMEYWFPYDDFDPIEIPDRQLSGVYSIGEAGVSRQDPGQLIAEALASPTTTTGDHQ
jgi:hypothetical protein